MVIHSTSRSDSEIPCAHHSSRMSSCQEPPGIPYLVAAPTGLWPALVGPGDARQRLDPALDALFGVIDAHLPLLLASGQVFHRDKAASINFSEPFARLFEDGIADGSLAPPGGDPAEAAELLFNTVCWSYAHLRGRHHWSAERARHGLRRLTTPGLVAAPGPGTRPADP
jgi:hypothetical protein